MRPQNLDAPYPQNVLGVVLLGVIFPSNIWGLYTLKIFDGWGSVTYLGAVDPQNI